VATQVLFFKFTATYNNPFVHISDYIMTTPPSSEHPEASSAPGTGSQEATVRNITTADLIELLQKTRATERERDLLKKEGEQITEALQLVETVFKEVREGQQPLSEDAESKESAK
jgi:hypothetical protein